MHRNYNRHTKYPNSVAFGYAFESDEIPSIGLTHPQEASHAVKHRFTSFEQNWAQPSGGGNFKLGHWLLMHLVPRSIHFSHPLEAFTVPYKLTSKAARMANLSTSFR